MIVNLPIALRIVAFEASIYASNPNYIHVRLQSFNLSFSRIFSISQICSRVVLLCLLRVSLHIGSFFNIRRLLDCSILYPITCKILLTQKISSFLLIMLLLFRKSMAS